MYRRPSPRTQAHGLFLLRVLRNPFEVTERPLHLSRFSHSPSTPRANSPDARLGFVRKELEELQSLKPFTNTQVRNPEDVAHVGRAKGSTEDQGHLEEVEISHPWPEWVELMEMLLKKDYLDHYGVQKLSSSTVSSSSTHSKDSNHIRTACLNFARDRFDLIRLFSRKDIQVIVGSGCPSLDRKVVNSGKRLRAHVGIEEGNVCCLCNLRGNCERAYVKAREDEGGRTVDVIRILLTYGLDFMTGSVENQPCLSRKVKESVRRLLKEIVEFSETKVDSNSQEAKSSGQLSKGQINVMKQGDWICPTCNFLNFAKNVKCLRCDGVCQEKLKKLREDREHLPLKKGDWICGKCNFLNFAKNTKCLQCNEKPPKRELNPGEWECESCNYINFRRNMVCLKCDWKRPKASNSGDSFAPFQHEKLGIDKCSKFSFVRNGDDVNQRHLHLTRSESQVKNEEMGSWNGDDSTFMKFKDFPIAGGKSTISQNPRQQQRWKGKMLISSRGRPLRREHSGGDGGRDSVSRGGGLDESSDEDEMTGWFGY